MRQGRDAIDGGVCRADVVIRSGVSCVFGTWQQVCIVGESVVFTPLSGWRLFTRLDHWVGGNTARTSISTV